MGRAAVPVTLDAIILYACVLFLSVISLINAKRNVVGRVVWGYMVKLKEIGCESFISPSN